MLALGNMASLEKDAWKDYCEYEAQLKRADLFETLVPYFKVGLEARELCVWPVWPDGPGRRLKARRVFVVGLAL